MKRLDALLLALVAPLLLTGFIFTEYVPVDHGEIATPGVVIEAEDGAFTLRAGDSFRTPFQFKCSGSSGSVADRRLNIWTAPSWLAGGARKVRVTLPGSAQSFHGVLGFCQIDKRSYGPGRHAHRIRLTDEEMDAVKEGRRVMVREKVPFKEFGDTFERPLWVLFLSEDPFYAPGERPSAEAMRRQSEKVQKRYAERLEQFKREQPEAYKRMIRATSRNSLEQFRKSGKPPHMTQKQYDQMIKLLEEQAGL